MTHDELLELLDSTTQTCQELVKEKNHDYTAQADVLANFRLAESLGLCSAETAVLVRMCDKLSRLATLLTRDAKVDESFEDTIHDLINYSGILKAVRADNIAKAEEFARIKKDIPDNATIRFKSAEEIDRNMALLDTTPAPDCTPPGFNSLEESAARLQKLNAIKRSVPAEDNLDQIGD